MGSSLSKPKKNVQPQPGPGADYDMLMKMLLIGDNGVGKSCLLLRVADDTYTDSYISTFGVDFKIVRKVVEGKECKLQIWDTVGEERFRTITSSYYRGAHGILMVYDVSERQSFENIKRWNQEIDKYASPNVARILVANKNDMKQVVTTKEGQDLANQLHVSFVEVSAKTGEGTSETFDELARLILGFTMPNIKGARKE
mmetsp:Transcript_40621/g.56464  ORF Transcript_40621/g.56464 Transcript_40621/m.56464 type:complete len:199 (+) Transcript_40621:95-691(+)